MINDSISHFSSERNGISSRELPNVAGNYEGGLTSPGRFNTVKGVGSGKRKGKRKNKLFGGSLDSIGKGAHITGSNGSQVRSSGANRSSDRKRNSVLEASNHSLGRKLKRAPEPPRSSSRREMPRNAGKNCDRKRKQKGYDNTKGKRPKTTFDMKNSSPESYHRQSNIPHERLYGGTGHEQSRASQTKRDDGAGSRQSNFSHILPQTKRDDGAGSASTERTHHRVTRGKSDAQVPYVVDLIGSSDSETEVSTTSRPKEKGREASPVAAAKARPKMRPITSNVELEKHVELVCIGHNAYNAEHLQMRLHPSGLMIRFTKNRKIAALNISMDDITEFKYSQQCAVHGVYSVVQISIGRDGKFWKETSQRDGDFKRPFPVDKDIGSSIWLVQYHHDFEDLKKKIEVFNSNSDQDNYAAQLFRSLWQPFDLEQMEVRKLEEAISKNQNDIQQASDGGTRANAMGGVRRSTRLQTQQFVASSGGGASSSGPPSSRTRHRKSRGNAITLFRYPIPTKDGKRPRVTITDLDRDRCKDDFLNDNVIDFYMMRLTEERYTSYTDEFYIYSSFFYKRFVQGLRNVYQDSKRAAFGNESNKVINKFDNGFSYVEKWTKNIDIFSKKYLLIPINKDLHWSLIIICNPSKICKPQSRKKFAMLHFDSLGCHNSTSLTKILFQYLRRAWDRHCKDTGKGEISSEPPRRHIKIPKGIPKQSNSSDCGVFVCLYAHYFLYNAISSNGDKKVLKYLRRDEFEGNDFTKYGIGTGKQWFSAITPGQTRQKLITMIDIHKDKYENALKMLQRAEDVRTDGDQKLPGNISKETPTKETPTKETPTKETPTKETPAKETPTKGASAKKISAENDLDTESSETDNAMEDLNSEADNLDKNASETRTV